MDALERFNAGIGDAAIDELGEPRVTDTCLLGNPGPVTALGFKPLANFNVEVHAPILGKFSCEGKEHFPSQVLDPRLMEEKHISQVVADNLSYWMGEAGLTQAALAEKAGVNQKTISNYLNPHQRRDSASGKPPSPKLTELELIAKALHIEVWHLVREISPKERAMYEAIERAYRELVATTKPAAFVIQDSPT